MQQAELPDNHVGDSPEPTRVKPMTGPELLEAMRKGGIVGMWKDRTDIQDSSAFARELRRRAQTRTEQ
jgi:hypothetical protein